MYKDLDYWHMLMSEEENNILRYNRDKKYLKTSFMIYVEAIAASRNSRML